MTAYEALRRVREVHGMNQRQLAQKAGVSQSTITRAERGATPIPEAVYGLLGVKDEGQLLAAGAALPVAVEAGPMPLPADLSRYADARGKANVLAWEAAGGSAALASKMLGGTPTRQAIARSVEAARRRKLSPGREEKRGRPRKKR